MSDTEKQGEIVYTISRSIMSGSELDTMDSRTMDEAIGCVSVFYRTTPRHKMAIISALQRKGLIVAMTGDGGYLHYIH